MGLRDIPIWQKQAKVANAMRQLQRIEAASFPNMTESSREKIVARLRDASMTSTSMTKQEREEKQGREGRAALATLFGRKG